MMITIDLGVPYMQANKDYLIGLLNEKKAYLAEQKLIIDDAANHLLYGKIIKMIMPMFENKMQEELEKINKLILFFEKV